MLCFIVNLQDHNWEQLWKALQTSLPFHNLKSPFGLHRLQSCSEVLLLSPHFKTPYSFYDTNQFDFYHLNRKSKNLKLIFESCNHYSLYLFFIDFTIPTASSMPRRSDSISHYLFIFNLIPLKLFNSKQDSWMMIKNRLKQHTKPNIFLLQRNFWDRSLSFIPI